MSAQVAPVEPLTSATAGPARGTRKDIQALRAFAVFLVVVYHLWPQRLSGGYVGVDVFFVISGFLITSHLVARPPRSFGDLATFWARRIKRLLPLTFVVVLSTLAMVRFIAPVADWANSAKQAVASVFYVQNWWLANESVDYLAAENQPSAFQHFWSLSVEEQFYIVWPVLIAVVQFLTTRMRWRNTRAVLGIALAGVIALPIAYSVVETAQNPNSSYLFSIRYNNSVLLKQNFYEL